MLRMLKCSSPQQRAGRGGSGEGLTLLSGDGYWQFDHAPVTTWMYRLDFYFGGVKATGGGADLGGLGRRVIGVHYIKLLNNQ